MSTQESRTEKLTRRRWLRGAGVLAGLPWLESIPVWGQSDEPGDASALPQRLGVLFMACGIHPNHWWAKGQGNEMELSRCLQPLDALKSNRNLINGLFNKNATGVGIHTGQTGNILSGAALKKGASVSEMLSPKHRIVYKRVGFGDHDSA